MLLVGTLVNYEIQVPQLFKVEVTACEASIVVQPAQNTLNSWSVQWGSESLQYNIANTINAFS